MQVNTLKMYFLYDEDGFFIGDSLTEEDNSTDIRPHQPCWKPKWDGEKWIETATDEEMNPPAPVLPPTNEEKIEMLEKDNVMLGIQVTDLEIELMDAHDERQALGQMITELELAIMDLQTRGGK